MWTICDPKGNVILPRKGSRMETAKWCLANNRLLEQQRADGFATSEEVAQYTTHVEWRDKS